MIAIDTNLVVRYAVKDDTEQTRVATDFLRGNRCLLLPTVLLESVWVLGSRTGYALPPVTVVRCIRRLAGLPTVTVENAAGVSRALDWYEAGMDFADALHLALAGGRRGIVTLDRGLAAAAQRLGLPHPVLLLRPNMA